MTTKQQYEQVIISANSALSSVQGLEVSTDETDLILDGQLTLLENTLLSIEAAAQAKLDAIEQEQVMAGFLAEMKVVFEKYSAKLEVGSTESGSGSSYGGSGTVGIKLTATFEGVTSTKEIDKPVITSVDLV